MPRNSRIPTPKTQKEIFVSQQELYNQAGPGFQPTGNPNLANTPNRGDQISFKGDTTKPFSIGIQDIDESIMYYFQNVIKPFVMQNGTRLEVPVIYGSPEKWASFQKFGYFRDSQGRIMMPLIMFKRDSVDKVRSIANKLDANNPHNVSIARKKYSPKNAYDNFSVLNNVIPQRVNYAVVVPDPSRFQFRAMIDSFAIKTELSDKEERTVSSTFNIKMNGYIIPDVIQKDLTALKKIPDIVKVRVEEQILGESTQTYNPPSPSIPTWLLSTGYWNDSGFWNDLDYWVD
jgi:hypothetical protein